jgi:hypothetical protein
VIAEDRDGAVCHMDYHGFDGELRIGAISDMIAEEHVAVDPVAAGMIETGRKGLPVGVDIGEEGDPHG